MTEHIELGQNYDMVKKIYSISILYFDLGHGNDYVYHGQTHFIGVHTGDELQVSTKERGVIESKSPSEIYPEYYLIRVNEFNKVAITPLEEWVNYLKTGVIRPDTQTPGLAEAREKLQYYNMSLEERHAYEKHIDAIMIQNDVLNTARLEGLEEGREKGRAEGRIEGRAEGRAEGLAEGERRKQKEVARNLKANGVAIEIIEQATGLSLEDINNL